MYASRWRRSGERANIARRPRPTDGSLGVVLHPEKAHTAIAAHFGVSRQSIRNWIVGLGGELENDEHDRAFRDKIAVTLGPTDMLCSACDIICGAHGSGLCASCRGDVEWEHDQEVRAELEMFSASAFLNNPRNFRHFDRSTTDCIRGVIPVW